MLNFKYNIKEKFALGIYNNCSIRFIPFLFFFSIFFWGYILFFCRQAVVINTCYE